MSLRSEDFLKCDLIYICSPEEVEGLLKDFSFENDYSDDENDENDDENGIVLKSCEPCLCSQHEHFLFESAPPQTSNIEDQVESNNEEDESGDGVYCDVCERLLEKNESSWTCLLPYCHFDLCKNCKTDSSDETDYNSPLYLIGTKVSSVSNNPEIGVITDVLFQSESKLWRYKINEDWTLNESDVVLIKEDF